jgi:probable rRNA maturation factor
MSVRLSGPPRRPGGAGLDRALLVRRARALLRALGHGRSELSLSLVDDAAIAALNARDRGKAGPTDVLSYSLLEGPHSEQRGALLGDVVISIDTAARQAREGRRSLDDECLRLLVHGVLHLLGHDHVRDDDARRMRAEERRLLRAARESPEAPARAPATSARARRSGPA